MNHDFLLTLLEHLKYWGVFLGAFIEGPATAVLAGFLSRSFLQFLPALIAHFMGDFLADMFYFSLGRSGNKKVLNWFQAKLHFSRESLYNAKRKFEKHHLKIIFVGKLTHFLGLPVIIGMGLSDYSWKKFALFNFVATIIKSTALMSLGYTIGLAWQQTTSRISRIIMLLLLCLTFISSLLFIKKKK